MFKYIKLLGFNLLLLLMLTLGVELALHFLFTNSQNSRIQRFASYTQLLKKQNTPLYTPHRYLGYIPTPRIIKGKNRHNQLGFRGPEIQQPKPDSCYRIVCLGGSTTYTVDVEDYQHSYPFLLEKALHAKGYKQVEVINSGAGGWSSWESLINLSLRIQYLAPDLLVIYHGINDVHARVVWPPEAYLGDNSGRRIAKGQMTINWWEIMKQQSNILRLIRVRLGYQAPAKTFRSFDDYPNTALMYDLHQQFSHRSYPQGIFTQVPLAKMLDTNQPIFFRKNIGNILDLAAAWKVDAMLASFAYLENDETYVTADPAYQQAIGAQNVLLQELAQNYSIPFLDYARSFPQDSSLYADAIHVNEIGSAQKALLFADFIEQYFLQGN